MFGGDSVGGRVAGGFMFNNMFAICWGSELVSLHLNVRTCTNTYVSGLLRRSVRLIFLRQKRSPQKMKKKLPPVSGTFCHYILAFVFFSLSCVFCLLVFSSSVYPIQCYDFHN